MRNPLNMLRAATQPEIGTSVSSAKSRTGILQTSILIALAGVTSCAKAPNDNLKPAPKPGTRIPLEKGTDDNFMKPYDPPIRDSDGSMILEKPLPDISVIPFSPDDDGIVDTILQQNDPEVQRLIDDIKGLSPGEQEKRVEEFLQKQRNIIKENADKDLQRKAKQKEVENDIRTV